MKLALTAVVGLCVVASACGGVEREPNLATAAERTEAAGSTRIEMTAALTQDGAESDVVCEGAADYDRGRFRLACKADQEVVYEMRRIGKTSYVRSGDPDAAKPWTRLPADHPSDDELSPHRLLGLLRSASRQTERIGEESVRGEETVHYAMTVDCEAAAELTDCPDETTVVDVWVDGDGLVRRIRAELQEGEVEIEFFDFGAVVEVEPPPEDQVGTFDIPKPGPCTETDAKPISVQRAIDVVGGHGFEVTQMQPACEAGVATTLSNFESSELDEGVLLCHVLPEAAGDGLGLVVTSAMIPGRSDLAPIERQVENLQCKLYVEERQREQALARLDAALAELR